MLVNSEKGETLLHESSCNIQLKEIDLKKAMYNICPTCMKESKRKIRDAFLSSAEENGLKEASKKWCQAGKVSQVAYTCKLYIKKILGDR